MSMVPWKGRISSRLLSQLRMRKRRSRTKRERKQQKDKEKELFYRCKAKCICSGICTAKGLKECTICHEIKKSACNKACCIDEIKPKMIPTATATSTRRKVKYKDELDNDESDNFEEEECNAFEEESGSFEKHDDPENSEENESANDGMLISQRIFMKHGAIFICPLMRVKLLESGLQGYVKQKGAEKIMHRSDNPKKAGG